ncbi:MAG: hypothetical protein ACK4RG_03425 [Fimbriimonadales bacterium]
MRSILAAGWLLTALLAFWLAYWAGEESALMQVGMAIYALLLILTMVMFARDWLNALRDGGGRTQ